MTRFHRAIIFYLFLFVFLISAPLVVLYTSGYRYSFRTGRIARVGTLILKSTPRGVIVALNNHTIKTQTPASLELAADEYRVTVTKHGFHPWIKLLPVTSQKTTFAEDIILWKDTRAAELTEIVPLATTLRGDMAVAYDPLRGLTIYKSASDTLIPIADLPVADNKIQVLFSPNEDNALVTYTDLESRTRFLAIRVPEGTMLDTEFLTPFAFVELVWGESAGTLYGVSRGRLLSANLFTRRVDTIATSGSPFLIRDTTVWSISGTERSLLVKSQIGNAQLVPEPVVELPPGSFTILPAPDPYLLLHETEDNRLLLINLENPTEILVELAGNRARPRISKNNILELIAWNEFELWLANATTGEQELWRRQGEPIRDAAWYPRGEYVAIAYGDRVEMIELDQRGGRNATLLARFPDHQVRDLLINPNGAEMFITVTDGPQSGIYSLELQ